MTLLFSTSYILRICISCNVYYSFNNHHTFQSLAFQSLISYNFIYQYLFHALIQFDIQMIIDFLNIQSQNNHKCKQWQYSFMNNKLRKYVYHTHHRNMVKQLLVAVSTSCFVPLACPLHNDLHSILCVCQCCLS